MALYQYGSSSKAPPPIGRTEFEILKASHKFLREGDDKNLSWEEQLASKYYDSLYREFAVCDLKHYKSGNFALRWRTEQEVLDGSGETTCGNTRCEHHPLPRFQPPNVIPPALSTLELPFAYVEQGETKSALVKVVLCGRCFDKLMWKRRKEKERQVLAEVGEVVTGTETSGNRMSELEGTDGRGGFVNQRAVKTEEQEVRKGWGRKQENEGWVADDDGKRRHRKRSSRSRSPRSRRKYDARSPRRTSKHRSSQVCD